ncbi:purine-nucleoside phosphorylase [Anaerosolibacter carboniphilus]|uniref:Purine nucleoside phosphorylase n=1 Tax=Anaerosolibacter carboniphilus TaxID=1417629 RepID=A0A841KSE1_9FIRM|nr:purine-nucleoside phosphorylase [Anaerosolibacter carboniphilus]MBB6216654.1 purine-nucleoside phosphorylase [Anaerosolibacter carboniphilus]
MKNLLTKIEEATNYIQQQTDISPKIGLILGSGLGMLADEIQDPIHIHYKDIPNFPVSTVKGHAGKLVLGKLEDHNVIAMQGRFHYYEGYSMEEVTFPVRVMKALGVEILIVTNAAGGVNTSFHPGDLMVISDHINWGFDNPLIGKNFDALGVRFPDISQVYDKELIRLVQQAGVETDLVLKEGVYAMFTGPTYETPAEVKMARFLGADAVGMSTVPEVIVAAHSKMKVLGISCITNMAAGILDQPLDHHEVIETADKVRNAFILLLKNTLTKIGRNS